MQSPDSMVIGVLGSTGLVGRALLNLLEHDHRFKKIVCFGSAKSKGQTIKFRDDDLIVYEPSFDHLKNFDLIFAMTDGDISKPLIDQLRTLPKMMIIDNASTFRLHQDVPLMIPSINGSTYQGQNLISVPNCTTIALLIALAPILKIANIVHCFCATYQSVSGSGSIGLEVLTHEQKNLSAGNLPLKANQSPYSKPIAGNVIPQCDRFDGKWTLEEIKMIRESEKILGYPFPIQPTCVRVPVFQGHQIAVTLELDRELQLLEIEDAIAQTTNIIYYENDFPSAFEFCTSSKVHLSRLRINNNNPRMVSMWIGADNIYVGAATCAYEIAKLALTNPSLYHQTCEAAFSI